jgi:hypothetical protein
MGFFNAFGYEFYVAKGTSSSVPPVSASGLTLVKNLSDGGIQSNTQSQEVITYDTETLGWSQSIATQNSYSINCTLNIDTQDASYKLLKEAARDAGAGVMLRWFRQTPLAAASGLGAAQYLTITNPSSAGTPGSLNNLATTTSGGGTGLLVDMVIGAGGTATSMVPDSANLGTGYAIGDTVTVSAVLATTNTTVTSIVQAITGTGTKERHSGVASVTNFSESVQAGSVASCTFQLSGYGSYLYLAAV